MKNGQSIEIDNCITTIIYILSFTVTIFMYQAQLINTESVDRRRTDNTLARRRTIKRIYKDKFLPLCIEISSHCVEMKKH
jgi:hypothetical protein